MSNNGVIFVTEMKRNALLLISTTIGLTKMSSVHHDFINSIDYFSDALYLDTFPAHTETATETPAFDDLFRTSPGTVEPAYPPFEPAPGYTPAPTKSYPAPPDYTKPAPAPAVYDPKPQDDEGVMFADDAPAFGSDEPVTLTDATITVAGGEVAEEAVNGMQTRALGIAHIPRDNTAHATAATDTRPPAGAPDYTVLEKEIRDSIANDRSV